MKQQSQPALRVYNESPTTNLGDLLARWIAGRKYPSAVGRQLLECVSEITDVAIQEPLQRLLELLLAAEGIPIPVSDASAPLTAGAIIWRPGERELWIGGLLVKKFTGPADRQEPILARFQQAGWPPAITMPLRGALALPRRKGALRRLNGCQHPSAILRFRLLARGRCIRWEFVRRSSAT